MAYSEDIEDLNRIQSQKYRNNLINARASAKKRNLLDNTKTLAKSATPWGAASLVKYLFLTHPAIYFLTLLAALLKDILDWIGIGSLPVIGSVVTFCFSILIFFMMLIAGSSGKMKMASKMVRRYLVLAGGAIMELLFGINFLPILTCTVLVIWFMAAAEKKQEVEDRKKSGMEEE